jgi:formate dehydrogenase (NADP+) beta subunit
VQFRYETPLKPRFGISEIMSQGYRAVFVAVGASRGRQLQLEGGDADGVINAIDYLININRGYRLGVGRKVVVVGGGLVAIDAARTAVRAMVPGLAIAPEEEAALEAGTMRVALDAAREAARRGALDVTVVSLESEAEMPAMRSSQGREELEAAREEGVNFISGWGPRRIAAASGRVSGIELMRCLRTYDDAVRFHPQFDRSHLTMVAADTVILAIGQAPDLSFLTPNDGLDVTPAGTLRIDPLTLATSKPGVFAGGDAAFPPGLLITAAAQGKLAARSIDAYLTGKPPGPARMHVTIEELPADSCTMVARYEQIGRDVPIVPLERRSGIAEIESRFSGNEARVQAQRCLFCHVHPIYDGARCILCNRCVDICPEQCLHFAPANQVSDPAPLDRASASGAESTAFLYDEERCIRCGLCAIRCPTAAITMERFQFEERQD